MTVAYAARASVRHVDGTPLFQSTDDQRAERDVAVALGQAWQCTLRPFGALAAIDWYAVRDERLVGVVELKHRSHASTRFPTVFLNVRKWLALLLAGQGLGVPSIFVVQWTDQLGWVSVPAIDARQVIVGGCAALVKSVSDIEPVIEVPVASFRAVV